MCVLQASPAMSMLQGSSATLRPWFTSHASRCASTLVLTLMSPADLAAAMRLPVCGRNAPSVLMCLCRAPLPLNLHVRTAAAAWC